MHKKTIRGVPYFYTTVRDEGKPKTIYLGREYDEALNEEKSLHGEKLKEINNKFGILKLFFIFISVLILFHGIYSLYNLGYIGAAVYEYNNVELEINKFVSPNAILLVNGVSRAIPLNLADDSGVLGYDIRTLKLDLESGEYLVEIVDNGTVFSENVIVGNIIVNETVSNEPVVENSVTPQDFGIMATGAASVTVDLNMTYLGNSTKYGNNATCYNVTTTNSDTVVYNWWLNNISDTVLNMPFDTNSSTTTNDYSGYGNTGTLNSNVWVSNGKIGGAYNFDGSSNWISIPTQGYYPDEINDWTIEWWENRTDTSADRAVYLSDNTAFTCLIIGYSAAGSNTYWASSNHITFDIASNRPMGSIEVGVWNYFILKRNSTGFYSYKNGAVVDNGYASAGSICNDGVPLQIGKYATSYFYYGNLDEFKIYNRSLTESEILDHNNSIYNKVRNDRLAVGQNWTCQVYPNNNTGDGLSVNSSNLFITSNSIPVIENLNITSTNVALNDTNQNISINFVARDLDSPNDPVTNITNWWKNNISDNVLNMPFDTNSSTTTNDYSGYGNNGNVSITSAIKPTWNISGYIGGAYTFDGVDDWINISDSNILDLTNNISIEAWINPGSVQKAYADIADKGHNGATSTSGWVIQQNNLNQNQYYLAWYAGAGWQVSSTIALTANRWQHFAIVKNGLNVKAYQDGVQKFDWNATNATIQTNDIAVVIGNAYGLNRQFNGTIDEFRIYNRTLTVNEILDHNNSIYNKVRNDRLVAGDRWKASVWSNDNISDSIQVNSSEIYINNITNVTFNNASITPNPANTTDQLNLTINVTVAGSTPSYANISWYNLTSANAWTIFNSSVINLTNNIQNSSALFPIGIQAKGETWNATTTVYNANGISTTTNSTTIIISNSGPSIPTLLIPINNSNITTANVTFGYNSTDVDGDTISYSLFLNGVLNQSSIGNISLNFSDGNYNWSVITGDSGGNSSFAPNMTFTVDATKPIINITYPTNNTNSTNNNLNINYSVSDLNLDKCWYSNDSMSINTTITCGTNITTITWSEGLHNFTVWANDTLNNVNSSSVSFTIDTIAPAINITFPINNTNSSNTGLNINYTKSDSGIGVQSCWYSNDSMTSNTTLTGCANITTVTWAEGQHNVTIWVNDSVNNVNSSYVRFTIDTTAPNITFVSPTQNNNVNLSQSYITVNVSVNDSLDIIDTCRFNLNNTWYSMTKSSGNNFVYCNATVSSLADGAYNYNVTANDSLNNLGNSSTRSIRLDTTGPSVNITDPNNGDIITTNSLTINSIISDSLALDKCWYEHSNLNTTFVCGQNFSLSSLANNDYNISVYANDTLNNLDRDTIKFTINVAGTTTTPSGGGGGGGGSPSSTAGQIITQETETKIKLKQGQEKDSSLTFTNPGNEDVVINAIIPRGLIGKIMLKNEHSASSLIIKGKTAMFTLSSNPITLTMNIGETKKIDLDGDNKEESEVSLIDIIDDIIKLKIKTNEDTQTLILSTGESKQFITNSNFAYLKIKPGETNNLKISIIGKQPGIYVGNIIIKTNGVEKLIPITIEVNSENTMFNAILDLSEEYKNINLRDNLKVQITLSNKEAGVMGVRYVIKDSNGIEKYNVNESIYVNEFRSYTKDIDTIKLKEGEYIIGVEARYKNEVIVSSDRFRIAKEQGYGLITLVIIWILIILIVVRWYKKKLTKAF